MSTNFDEQPDDLADWISQAEAARLHEVTRQAISKLVAVGKLKTKTIGGRTLVSRMEVEAFRPAAAGRPRLDDDRELERIRRILADARPEVRRRIFEDLRREYPIHALEAKLGADAEVILDAIDRSGELTLRMFRGVIAEAAFEVYVIKRLAGWANEPLSGNLSHDFELRDGIGPVRVQVKLQRSQVGLPQVRKGMLVVETQRTRGGVHRTTGESTRPYRFGEFDILAVAMRPTTGRWDAFRYTVAGWLTPRAADGNLMEKLQPVAAEPNDDWTDDFETCVGWLRSGLEKKIRPFP